MKSVLLGLLVLSGVSSFAQTSKYSQKYSLTICNKRSELIKASFYWENIDTSGPSPIMHSHVEGWRYIQPHTCELMKRTNSYQFYGRVGIIEPSRLTIVPYSSSTTKLCYSPDNNFSYTDDQNFNCPDRPETKDVFWNLPLGEFTDINWNIN